MAWRAENPVFIGFLGVAVRKILSVTDLDAGVCPDFVQRTTIERIANFGSVLLVAPSQAIRLLY
jgi:hypothetical protein